MVASFHVDALMHDRIGSRTHDRRHFRVYPLRLPRLFKPPFVSSCTHPSAPPPYLLRKPKQTPNDTNKMPFNGPAFRVPPTVPERRYPAFVVVETSLRVWAISRWRGPRELAEWFLRAGFLHLPAGSPPMFRLEEQRSHPTAPPIGLVAHFTPLMIWTIG